MEIVVELYLRGFEARVLLLCSGYGGGEGMSKQFLCPHCEEEGNPGTFPVMGSKYSSSTL